MTPKINTVLFAAFMVVATSASSGQQQLRGQRPKQQPQQRQLQQQRPDQRSLMGMTCNEVPEMCGPYAICDNDGTCVDMTCDATDPTACSSNFGEACLDTNSDGWSTCVCMDPFVQDNIGNCVCPGTGIYEIKYDPTSDPMYTCEEVNLDFPTVDDFFP